jgi:hypothetical protein
MVNSLNTQLEEAKESEETLKSQLTKKEELCHTLELEVFSLKKAQLENKEEIKISKTKVVDLTKIEELKTCDKTNKCIEVLDNTE